MEVSFREMAEFTEPVVEHFHDAGFKCIISGGASNSVPTFMLKLIWKQKYPQERIPKIISIRWDEFGKSVGNVHDGIISDFLLKRGVAKFSANEIAIFDEYATSGGTIRSIRKALELCKIKGARYGVRAHVLFKSPYVGEPGINSFTNITTELQGEASYNWGNLKELRGRISYLRRTNPGWNKTPQRYADPNHQRFYIDPSEYNYRVAQNKSAWQGHKEIRSRIVDAVKSLDLRPGEHFSARKVRVDLVRQEALLREREIKRTAKREALLKEEARIAELKAYKKAHPNIFVRAKRLFSRK